MYSTNMAVNFLQTEDLQRRRNLTTSILIFTNTNSWRWPTRWMTFSFWSSSRCDLRSASLLTVKSCSSTCGWALVMNWLFPDISAQIRIICDSVSANSLIICCFFTLRSSKTGLIEDNCRLRVPFAFTIIENVTGMKKLAKRLQSPQLMQTVVE